MNYSKKNQKWRQVRQTRLAVIQALYQVYYSGITLEEVSAQFLNKGRAELIFDQKKVDEKKQILFEKLDVFLFQSVLKKISLMHNDIEYFIKSSLPNNQYFIKLELLIKIILLAGGAELLIGFVPSAVVISEYVELSHGFFEGAKETSLINGLLDGMSKKIIVYSGN